jgi:hypothetical protein
MRDRLQPASLVETNPADEIQSARVSRLCLAGQEPAVTKFGMNVTVCIPWTPAAQ